MLPRKALSLTQSCQRVIDKMQAKHLMITFLGSALIWGGVEVSRLLVAASQVEKQVEQTLELSKQETERVRLFAETFER